MLCGCLCIDEDTSICASVVLDLSDKKELIKQGVHWIIQVNNDTNAIMKVFKTLMTWLTAHNQANDLVTWISEIINGLQVGDYILMIILIIKTNIFLSQELQKYDVLLDLSCRSVKSCLNFFQNNGYQTSMCSILFHIMLVVEHSPEVFHMVRY